MGEKEKKERNGGKGETLCFDNLFEQRLVKCSLYGERGTIECSKVFDSCGNSGNRANLEL